MSHSGPLISVIIPTYNCASYISEAVDSVIAQDYSNIEIIVINDGSIDHTLSVLQKYEDKIILINQENVGAAVARNKGLECARGKYVAFLDADDVWLSHKLGLQVAYLENHPMIGMAYSSWRNWFPDESGRYRLPKNIDCNVPTSTIINHASGWLYNKLLIECLLLTSTVVIRRSLIERVGKFDEKLLRGQDYDYWLRVSRFSEIIKLQAELALYRMHGDGLVRNRSDHNYGVLILKKAVKTWGLVGPNGEATKKADIQKRLSQLYFQFGYHRYWAGNPAQSFRSFLLGVLHYPLGIKAWFYLILSLLPISKGALKKILVAYKRKVETISQ